MCDYMQREYGCGHYRWIATQWCRKYIDTHKRCKPNVTDFENTDIKCGECKSKQREPVKWEGMIRRKKRSVY